MTSQSVTISSLRSWLTQDEKVCIEICDVQLFLRFNEANKFAHFLMESTREKVSKPENHINPGKLKFDGDKPCSSINPWYISTNSSLFGKVNCSTKFCKSDPKEISFYFVDGFWLCKDHLPEHNASKFIVGQAPSEREELKKRVNE